ncbi:MAG: DUF4416 family protein [Endomicrobium sp.]|nr:DUF4416 family protein [Endomicrobium sp.]
MGGVSLPKKVKLFCGIIFSSFKKKVKQKSLSILEYNFGKIDLLSSVIPFNFSNYYNSEIGDDLRRFWISFEKLVFTSDLVETKIFTNYVENSFLTNNKRLINIDPGYVTPANVILATTKDFSHRIYLSNGIYGEVTVIYKNGRFIKLPWSYTDYLSESAIDFFLRVRENLVKQLRQS